jgi:hypothetical protein
MTAEEWKVLEREHSDALDAECAAYLARFGDEMRAEVAVVAVWEEALRWA